MTDRAAIVDCGTNTIRLLIADSNGNGGLVEQDREVQIVRLGQGIDATGEFHPDALQRTFAAVDDYAATIGRYGVPADRVRFLVTSAGRDAGNRDVFFDGIKRRLGAAPDVINGMTEAGLSFRGALSGIRNTDDPVLVMDIGGGSTELILGTGTGAISGATSLNIGSVRLTERCWTADPPAADDLAQAVTIVDGMLDQQDIGWARLGTWIGVAGTVTTLAAVHLDLDSYDRSRVHGHRIGPDDLDALYRRLAAMPAAAIEQLPTVPAKRADVLTAGTLIAARIAARVGAELTVSESDILDGAALELFASG
jgi:exopolyphosphatase/guanosine-5'-triphosphate,3'-diphosphate pyrophosphatase